MSVDITDVGFTVVVDEANNAVTVTSPGPQGVAGPAGATGDPGAAATIAVGTTSTLSPGSPATVTNSGTSGAAIFDFGVPEGVQGLTGPTGPTGPPGIEVDATPPVDTTILWADTGEPGDMVVPTGGAVGEALVKLSGSDYDTGWAVVASPTDDDQNILAVQVFR